MPLLGFPIFGLFDLTLLLMILIAVVDETKTRALLVSIWSVSVVLALIGPPL